MTIIIESALAVLWWIIGAAIAVGAVLALWRMVKGPTIVDRMVASDTILTITICLLGADMVLHGHTSSLPLMLALSMTAFIASVAVARYVSRQDKGTRERTAAAADADLTARDDGQMLPGLTTSYGYDRVQSPEEARLAMSRERAPRDAELRETEALEAEVHGAEEGHPDRRGVRGGPDERDRRASDDRSPGEEPK